MSGQSGTKYIHIDTVSDIAGNISTAVSNSFQFDNEAPKITISPNSQSSYTKSTSVTITVEDDGELSSSNEYEYYISTSSSYNSYGNWQPYESGEPFTIGTGLTGTYYIHVKSVEDNAGNSSGTKTSGAFYFDNTAPVVSATAPSSSAVTSQNVTINVSDTGGSGLSSNSYQYYLSSSSTSFSGGSWTNYTRGYSFPIGTGLNGQYYLFVKRVSDNCGNTSTYNGTLTYIGGTQYHIFGPYTFANEVKKLRVGDYVDYIPDGETTVSSSDLGISNTMSVEDLNWIVFDIRDDGMVELISENSTSTKLAIDFIMGYNNGVYVFNDFMNRLYKNPSVGATARNIKVEDVTSKIKDGFNYVQNPSKHYAYGSTATLSGQYNYPVLWKNVEGNQNMIDGIYNNGTLGRSEQNSKIYGVETTNTSMSITSNYFNLNSSTRYNMKTVETRDSVEDNNFYWNILCDIQQVSGYFYSTRLEMVQTSDKNPYFGVFYGPQILGAGRIADDIYTSSVSKGLRPIVTLPASSIDLSVGNGEKGNEWGIK